VRFFAKGPLLTGRTTLEALLHSLLIPIVETLLCFLTMTHIQSLASHTTARHPWWASAGSTESLIATVASCCSLGKQSVLMGASASRRHHALENTVNTLARSLLATDESEEAAHSLKKLWDLRFEAGCTKALAKAGALPTLVRLLGSSSDETASLATDILYTVAEFEENRAAIARALGAVPLLCWRALQPSPFAFMRLDGKPGLRWGAAMNILLALRQSVPWVDAALTREVVASALARIEERTSVEWDALHELRPSMFREFPVFEREGNRWRPTETAWRYWRRCEHRNSLRFLLLSWRTAVVEARHS
jgi:hypothetical protein